ncbi:hypothetical protein O3M35_007807 [Rhynocoris fuscipes]|uniref:Uncharacterized protein n=1 Tax=Rhynocoris fuscipes TaxID=488301 RepID=A0AAW1DAU8_9HEMI
MQLFAFVTISRYADYIKISSESDKQCWQQNRSNLRILCPPYFKNGLSLLKFFFLYSTLILLNLDLH